MKSPRHHGRGKPLTWIYFTFLSIRHFLCLITLATTLNAQSLTEQDCTIQLQDTGEKILNWTGHVGRTYFIPSSPDLIDWSWAPNIEAGANRPMSYEVDGPASAGFYRLQYTDLTAPNLEAADFDGDGLSNLAEITQRPRPTAATRNQSLQSSSVQGSSALPVQNGTRKISSKSTRATLSASIQTNPLKTDTDGDGLTDKWEEDHQLDPTDDGSYNPNSGPNGDPDGDGLDNAEEQSLGTNPFGNASTSDSDGDGISDPDEIVNGTDPNDYFNGQIPVITTISGSGQTTWRSQASPEPIVFQITREGIPLVNAPVHINHPEALGVYINPDDDTVYGPSMTLRTNSEGKVYVYFKAN